MKISTQSNNYARGQSDHDLIGRRDLPIYATSGSKILNCLTNFKGSVIVRTGWERMYKFQDCALYEYAFNESQNYILVFFGTTLRLLTYDAYGVFGWVESGGSPLEITTPYTLAHAKELQLAAHEDEIYVVHPSYAPYKLVRTGASTFTFSTFSRTEDYFASPTLTVSDTSTSSVAMATGALTFTVTAGKGYLPHQPITITYDATNYLVGTVTSYSGTTLVVDITFLVGSGTYATWTLAMTSNGYPSCVCFYGGRLFYAASSTKPTTIWGSVVGSYDDFTIPATIDADDALVFTIADISESIQWLLAGENSLIAGSRDALVAINGGSVGDAIDADSIKATITSVDGSSGVIPLRKDGQILYVGKNYRNVYYFSYNILTETFEAPDATIASFDITKSGFKKLRWKKDRNDIVYGLKEDGTIATLNFLKTENIIGWHQHKSGGIDSDSIEDIACITDNDGTPFLFGLIERDGEYFIERKAAHQEFSNRDDFYTGVEETDDEAWYRKVSDELLDTIYLDSSTTYSNLRTETIVYDPVTGTATSSGAVFGLGSVGHHIVYKTSTGYEHGRLLITGYTSTTVVSVTSLDTPTINTWASWYLTFSSLSGLYEYEGKTVSLVTDGAYYDDQVVTTGAVTYDDEVCVTVIGFKYRAMVKGFPLGFSVNGKNTFVTTKAITCAHILASFSWGGKIGSSQYHLQDIQRDTSKDINYLPAYPLNGTTKVDYTDDASVDKCFYFVQDVPAPFVLNCVTIEANYAV